MTAPVVRMPPLAEHLAGRASPHADLVVEAMCARRTQVAAIALTREGALEVEGYGPGGVAGVAAIYGRVADEAPAQAAVFVITPGCAGWVTIEALALAAERGAA